MGSRFAGSAQTMAASSKAAVSSRMRSGWASAVSVGMARTFSGCPGARSQLAAAHQPSPWAMATEFQGSPAQNPSKLPERRLADICGGGTTTKRTSRSESIPARASQARQGQAWVQCRETTPKTRTRWERCRRINSAREDSSVTPSLRRDWLKVMALPCRFSTSGVRHSVGTHSSPKVMANGRLQGA